MNRTPSASDLALLHDLLILGQQASQMIDRLERMIQILLEMDSDENGVITDAIAGKWTLERLLIVVAAADDAGLRKDDDG